MNDQNKKAPPESEDPSTLGRVRDRLYSAKSTFEKIQPHLYKATAPIARGWDHVEKTAGKLPFKLPSSQAFLLFSVGFFVLCLIVAGAFLVFGNRFITSEQVVIDIEAPTTIAGGDEASFILTLRNNNPTALKNAKLVVMYPEGTYASDGTTPQTRFEEELGEVGSGKKIERTLSAVLFGNAGDRVPLQFILEYETENSDEKFVKKKQFDVSIGTSPLLVSVDTVDSISSGQELVLVLTVRGNAPNALEGIALEAEYPFGFTPKSVDGVELLTPETTLFPIGTLGKGEERTITIRGVMLGEDGEERVFRFTGGVLDTKRPTVLEVVYASKDKAITISKPFLTTRLSLNRSEADTLIILPNEDVLGALSWQNTLESRLSDVSLSVLLEGNALDSKTIKSTEGFFDSNRNTVIYNKEQIDSLGSLAPGASGNGAFSFSLVPLTKLRTMKNPSVTLTLSLSGRSGEGGRQTTISSTLTKTVKVASDLALSARSVRTVGNIENMGPWPPEVAKETTYTIMLEAANSINTVADAVVVGKLPSYVRYTGVVSPSNTQITFNETTRELTWNVGELPSGGGAKTAQFQVAITPSESQKGKQPILFEESTLRGFDRFVQKEITAEAAPVGTLTETDPAFDNTQGAVK